MEEEGMEEEEEEEQQLATLERTMPLKCLIWMHFRSPLPEREGLMKRGRPCLKQCWPISTPSRISKPLALDPRVPRSRRMLLLPTDVQVTIQRGCLLEVPQAATAVHHTPKR
jgi:hypothetical protein